MRLWSNFAGTNSTRRDGLLCSGRAGNEHFLETVFFPQKLSLRRCTAYALRCLFQSSDKFSPHDEPDNLWSVLSKAPRRKKIFQKIQSVHLPLIANHPSNAWVTLESSGFYDNLPPNAPPLPPSIAKLVSLWACPATRFCQSGILFITSIVTIVISNQIPSAEKPPFINIPGQAPQSKSNASRTVPSSSTINLFCKLDNLWNKLIYL